MRRDLNLYLSALLFLALAVISGNIATGGVNLENRTAAATVSAGAGEIGGVLADILWIQMDRYHHIWMYQGHEWVTATDYLPQLWLVTVLNPGFPDAYIDGGYHLAVNLGEHEEGFRLLDRGIRNCPDNERIYWERLAVLWQTGYGNSRSVRLAAWDYLELVRKKRGAISEPWNEANATMITGFTFQEDSLRRNSGRLARRYEERRQFIGFARSNGIWSR